MSTEPLGHNLFYVPPRDIKGASLTIKGTELHHLRNVLRAETGIEIDVTDGAGSRFRCRITALTKDALRADIISRAAVDPGSGPALDVAFVPLKSARNDHVIEKGTELGVRAFVPFLSRHAVNQDVGPAKLERFRKLSAAAMMQSRRFFMPTFTARPGIDGLIALFPSYDLVLVADGSGTREIPPAAGSILYITGPEGGFDPEETARMQKAGARMVSLGSFRLRAETAVLAGIVKILTAYGIV